MITSPEPGSDPQPTRPSSMGAGDDTRVATTTSPEWIDIARAGFSGGASTEAMLWDDLDLDDPDDRRFGDYELLERIGRGGMGMVFRSRQFSLGREVAVKFIVGGLADNAQAIARFLAEARAAARLHHPHIVPVFEVGSVDGMHFFSMPLLRGQTLAQRIGGARMSQVDSVALMLRLGAAVEYAHSLGLLHLDLKPANVLFDEHAQPLIGDFGLARHMDDAGGVDAQEVSGTPAYMSPEQIQVGPHRLSARTDVYALGAILYELLTGAPPHGQGGAKTQMQQATTGGVVPPRTLVATIEGVRIDKDLEAICLKCLRVDPDQRYQGVAELNADLARWRDGNDVSVRKPAWHERVARSLRRNPAISLATTAALAALVIGLATTSWQWQQAERARAEATRQQAIASAQALRMQQLAGLMAAAFPAGESSRDERASSARAAVAWLKLHASNDPATERAVLTAFRQALSAANKPDVVIALVGEILDQLGEDYRQKQMARLANKGDRDSLIAAALIGMPRGVDGVSSAAHAAVLQRLFASYPDDPLALYVVALACHVQVQPCAHPEYYARLTDRFPDNAVNWVLAPSASDPNWPMLATSVLHAARAKRFDDQSAAFTVLLRAALRDQPAPDSIQQPMRAVFKESEVGPSLLRNVVGNAPLPHYADFLRVCKPESIWALKVDGLRDACGAFAQLGMHSPGASILARMISSAMLRRLYKGTPVEAEAKDYRREYAWLGEKIWPNGTSEPINAEQIQQDVARYGEWEAWQRQADREGVSRTPPPGWIPANPQTLLLSEERAPEAPHH